MCLNVADNEETVKLMKASGCKGILAGIESFSEKTLKAQNKATVNVVSHYVRQTKTLLKNGISCIGTLMYGFDEDTKEMLFDDTVKVVEELGLGLLHPHIIIPYPHTDYYRRLDEENRLITKEPRYYNGYTIVHRPKNIHPADLQEVFINTRKRFYSWRSILKRMLKHNFLKFPEFLIWNMAYRKPNYDIIPGVKVEEWLKYLKTL